MCKTIDFGSCIQVWPYRFNDLIQSFGVYYLEGIIVTYFHAEKYFWYFFFCRHLGLTSGSEVYLGLIMEVPLCSIFKSNETRSNMHIYGYNDQDSTLIFKVLFLLAILYSKYHVTL